MSSITTTETSSSTILNASGGNITLENDGRISRSPLEDLAEQISAKATIISDFLRSDGHPVPSFERDAPTTAIPASAPGDIRAARQALMEAALRIFQLVLGPAEYLPNLAVGYQYIACLRWLTHFKIFSYVPLTGCIPYSTLAATANVSEQQLKTVARMAMTSNLFCEPAVNSIAHSATSALLVTNPSFHDWAVFMSEASVPAAGKLVEASEKWPGSVEKNQTAYNIAMETDLPFFDHLATLPEKTKQFAGYMKNVTNSEGTAIKHLLDGYDWASLGKAIVVDVGGSTGSASIALSKAFPDLYFIVQDLPENARDGQTSLSSLDPESASRIVFQSHDFFHEQPFKGANVYLLRMILHDWPAHEATTILKGIVSALTKGSRVLIMDSVLPTPGSLPSTLERLIRARDMTMMQAFNSLERDLEDWKALLRGADERLTLVNVVQPLGSVMSVMEVAFEA